MGPAAGRAALESLKAEAARLREANERLQRQNKQVEREIQQLNTRGAQAQAKDIPAEEVGPFHAYLQKFPDPVGPAVLRSCMDVIQKADPKAVISVADSAGCIVVGTGGDARQQGISAKQVIDFWIHSAGGSGGGREGMAQGKIERLGLFSMQTFKRFFQERSKG